MKTTHSREHWTYKQYGNKKEKPYQTPRMSDMAFHMILRDTICKGGRLSAFHNRHYKIFCVNVKYGIQYEFRIFLFNSFAK